MTQARTHPGPLRPMAAVLFLLALAHNWAGITDAYFALWQWVGTEFAHALLPQPAGTG